MDELSNFYQRFGRRTSAPGRATQALIPVPGVPGAMYSDGSMQNIWYNGKLIRAVDFFGKQGGNPVDVGAMGGSIGVPNMQPQQTYNPKAGVPKLGNPLGMGGSIGVPDMNPQKTYIPKLGLDWGGSLGVPDMRPQKSLNQLRRQTSDGYMYS